jgi:hypothetical protein
MLAFYSLLRLAQPGLGIAITLDHGTATAALPHIPMDLGSPSIEQKWIFPL